MKLEGVKVYTRARLHRDAFVKTSGGGFYRVEREGASIVVDERFKTVCDLVEVDASSDEYLGVYFYDATVDVWSPSGKG